MATLDPEKHRWMRHPATCRIMAALACEAPERSARFVGGAVRNALLGCPVSDIDIATPLPPAEVVQRLHAAGLKAVPTGLAYGTITGIADGRPFEITTLRSDVATDGRHAEVAFGQNWAGDAARRDFTINALYATADGEIFDYCGGLADLASRRIRFIGDPVQRIREDYLRILRLFRFTAHYGTGCADDAALAAAHAERAGLAQLSGERIAKEMLKLLAADTPVPVLKTMASAGILAEIGLTGADTDRLQALCEIDHRNGYYSDPLLRLAALSPVPEIATRWRLSNAQSARLKRALSADMLPHTLDHRTARRHLYRMGAETFNDTVLLSWAADHAPVRDLYWCALLELGEMFLLPHFPLSGRDAMAMGVPAGPKVGKVLHTVENWWVENDFPSEPAILMQRLKAAALNAASGSC